MRFPLRVLVVDNSIEFIESAASFLALEPIVHMITYALSGADAMEKITIRNPDIVLVNWSLPDMSGLQLIQWVKALPKPPCVILLSLSDFPIYRSEAEQAGADGFIPKGEWSTRFVPVIREIFQVPSAIQDDSVMVYRRST
jgi:DNA-binding NarL/FixJ family response regulator